MRRDPSAYVVVVVVVTGPSGVGTTCLVETVLARRPGLVRVDAAADKSSDGIELSVHGETANTNTAFARANPLRSSSRVLRRRRLFSFGGRPTVLLLAEERSEGEPEARLQPRRAASPRL